MARMEKTQEQFSATPYIHVGWPLIVPDMSATPYIHVGWHSNTSVDDDDARTSGGRYLGRGAGPNEWHIV